jgi:hypothetical protein
MDRTRRSLRYDTRTPLPSRWRQLDAGLSWYERLAPRPADGSGAQHSSAHDTYRHGDRADHSNADKSSAVESCTVDRYTHLVESDHADGHDAECDCRHLDDPAQTLTEVGVRAAFGVAR